MQTSTEEGWADDHTRGTCQVVVDAINSFRRSIASASSHDINARLEIGQLVNWSHLQREAQPFIDLAHVFSSSS
jgi:hypothetical protein